jgi:predicted signal transduction protein with EAL and GGDEF domain
VAEGVETAEQLERLRSLGCDRMQGYLFARPRPAPELESWLADGFVNLPTMALPTRVTIQPPTAAR